jgi:hypothetical protein
MARHLFDSPGNSRVFAANYRGLCATCDDTIYPGDDVCYQGNELVHAECRGPVDLDRPVMRRPSSTPEEVCPECSMIHRGECL